MLFCHKIHYIFVINALFPQYFVLSVYALFSANFVEKLKSSLCQFFRFLDAWSCRRVLQNRELYIFHSVQCSGCGAFAGISEMSRKQMTSRPQLDQPIITMTDHHQRRSYCHHRRHNHKYHHHIFEQYQPCTF